MVWHAQDALINKSHSFGVLVTQRGFVGGYQTRRKLQYSFQKDCIFPFNRGRKKCMKNDRVCIENQTEPHVTMRASIFSASSLHLCGGKPCIDPQCIFYYRAQIVPHLQGQERTNVSRPERWPFVHLTQPIWCIWCVAEINLGLWLLQIYWDDFGTLSATPEVEICSIGPTAMFLTALHTSGRGR